MGWLYYKKGDYDKAITEVLKAHQKLPDDPTIAEHLGDIYVSLKDYDKAKEYYNKSLSLEKNNDRKKAISKKLKDIEDKFK